MEHSGLVCEVGPVLLLSGVLLFILVSDPKSSRDFRETGPRPELIARSAYERTASCPGRDAGPLRPSVFCKLPRWRKALPQSRVWPGNTSNKPRLAFEPCSPCSDSNALREPVYKSKGLLALLGELEGFD